MSEALEKFNPANLAAIIGSENLAAVNTDFSGGINTDFLPTISIRGKEFRLKIAGEEKVVPNRELKVFFIASRPNISKTFYAGSWKPGQEASAPDCSSADGIYPDSNVATPQHTTCQLCPNNAWGSKISETGGKGKACQDYKLVVLVLQGYEDNPFVLRIPPASLKPFGAYVKRMEMMNVPVNAAVTRITFEDTEFPNLRFEFGGETVKTREQFMALQEVAASVEVTNAIKIQPRAAAPAALPEATAVQPVVAEVKEVEAPAPAAAEPDLATLLASNKKKTTKKKAAEVVEEAPAPAEDNHTIKGLDDLFAKRKK